MNASLSDLEQEWENRRAALVAGGVTGNRRSRLEDELFKKRGGGGSLAPRSSGTKFPNISDRLSRADRELAPISGQSSAKETRSRQERLEAVANGSQPAVVKMASYGGGSRFGTMAKYISRDGEIKVETERGEHVSSREDFARLREEWSPLFQNRSDSRDVAGFSVQIEASAFSDEVELQDSIRVALNAGFGQRRYAYTVYQPRAGRYEVSGVVVLRAANGERLTADAQATKIVQSRYDAAVDQISSARASFAFSGYGNGVEYVTSKLKSLVETTRGDVFDEQGRKIANEADARKLSQQEWRHDLHSRKGRDVMHVIMSAKAGTDADTFKDAARDFLAEQFEGHRYVFSLHDPTNDPKEAAAGGKRPHIHVHALVAMRNEYGGRITTNPATFRQWRVLLAENARNHGISMEMTDRRELASAPAFTRNQVKPVSRAGRTHHIGTSDAAQRRYDSKRRETRTVAATPASVAYAFEAKETWAKIAANNQNSLIAQRAADMQAKLSVALNSTDQGQRLSVAMGEYGSEYEASIRNVAEIVKEGEVMRSDMTREEVNSYEASVDKALSIFEKNVDPAERDEFDRIAKAAKATVAAHRNVVELKDELDKVQSEARPNSVIRDAVSALASLSPTNQAAAVIAQAVKGAVGPNEQEEHENEAEVRKTSLPAHVTDRYFVQQSASGSTRIFSNSQASRELFQDAGERLRSKTYDATAVKLMVETAAHRGWTSVEIAGSKEFRREAWLEGQARGIAVKGYQPNELDWQEVTQREQMHLKNEIRHSDDKTIVRQEDTDQRAERQQKFEETTQPIATSGAQGFRAGVTGVLIEQGTKPYKNDPKNEPSPYAVLKTEDGEKILWGVDIPDAITRADAVVGNTVTLRELGMEKVEKTIIKEIDGMKVQSVEMVDRRSWEAEVLTVQDKQTSQVASSLGDRSMLEKKGQVTKANATNDQAVEQHQSRLEQIENDLQAKRDQGEQER